MSAATTTTPATPAEAKTNSPAAVAAAPAGKRGAFILLEGLDRSGKTGQVKRLAERLTALGHPAVAKGFPDRGTGIGSMINGYLQNLTHQSDEVAHLLFSANRWECAGAIEAALAAGQTLVVDRYSYSGVAYSHCKGLDFEWCVAPERGLPAPDVVFFLNVSEAVAAQRGGFGEERYERVDFQRKVRAVFDRLRACDKGPRWVTVDADQSIDAVAAAIEAEALSVVAAVADTPVSKMQHF